MFYQIIKFIDADCLFNKIIKLIICIFFKDLVKINTTKFNTQIKTRNNKIMQK